MENKTTKMDKVANLLEKIDKKTKELKQLKMDLRKVFNDISDMWKEESSMLFPQLKPCDIGEYVGVNVTIKDKVYNIFISEYRRKLYCMFSLDRKNKEYNVFLKDAMDQADFDKLRVIVNDYVNQHEKKVTSTGTGYYVEFEKDQYDDAFQLYLEIVRTFV